MTLDLDFADIRSYPPEQYQGIVVFRLDRQDKAHVLDVAAGLGERFDTERLAGCLWIVEEGRIRIREGQI